MCENKCRIKQKVRYNLETGRVKYHGITIILEDFTNEKIENFYVAYII